MSPNSSPTAGLPINQPILLADMPTNPDAIDWGEVYGRYGTATHIFHDLYVGPTPPEHLRGQVTHVWLYWAP